MRPGMYVRVMQERPRSVGSFIIAQASDYPPHSFVRSTGFTYPLYKTAQTNWKAAIHTSVGGKILLEDDDDG